MKILGIDLAASERRDTGVCILNDERARAFVLHSDSELLAIIQKEKPKLVAIDAPLSLPKGRKSIDEKINIHFRECDVALRKLKIKFFPITLGPMRELTKRGMMLKKEIEKSGAEVIEVYPGATYDIFNINRKDKRAILDWVAKNRIKLTRKNLTQDELDAIAAAITGKFFIEKKAEAIGNKEEGLIIIPKKMQKLGKN
jgi:predicted nuclease with RNAse H fold